MQLKTDGTTVIAYANFSQPDRQALENYIQSLASFPIEKLNRKEQYAFWLNLYNALVVRLVLENYLKDQQYQQFHTFFIVIIKNDF